MRIAILTHGISPFGHFYVQAFARAGHEAAVLSLTPSEQKWPGTTMRVVGPPGFRPWQTPTRWIYLKTIRPVRRAVREIRPDIVFGLYLSSGGLLACLSGHPHIAVSAHGSDVNTRIGSRLWRRIFRWQARRACVVHAVSDGLADTLARDFGLDRGRIIVSPIGVDPDELGYVDPAARPNAGRIVCTRAHVPVYDQPTLVRALKRLRDGGVACHLVYASARNEELTRPLVRKMGLDEAVTFLGGYAFEELPGILGGADVYVSAATSDGTSQSLLEAMSTGTFPVVTDIPANRPWVEHERNGLLFPPGDDAALAECLARAFDDADLRARAAPINRRIVLEKADSLKGAETLLAAFEQCLRD